MKQVFWISLVMAVAVSCAGAINDVYFHRAQEGRAEFHDMAEFLLRNRVFQKADSAVVARTGKTYLSDFCVYPDHYSEKVRLFMKEYEIQRICLDRKDSMVEFVSSGVPYLGKVKVVLYDFGKSRYRTMENTAQLKIKVVDSGLVYYRTDGIGFN